MKSKLMIASLLLAGACAANLNAQEKRTTTLRNGAIIFLSV